MPEAPNETMQFLAIWAGALADELDDGSPRLDDATLRRFVRVAEEELANVWDSIAKADDDMKRRLIARTVVYALNMEIARGLVR